LLVRLDAVIPEVSNALSLMQPKAYGV